MRHSASPLSDNSASVLVAVLNNQADWARARDEGWYRIPVARAPQPLASDYLAFYFTAAFGQERWRVSYIAEVWQYELRRRCDLIAEPDHPRAQALYHCLRLGPLQRLQRPVPARALRRVTFIHTTLERLLVAEDVRDLWPRRALPTGQSRHVLEYEVLPADVLHCLPLPYRDEDDAATVELQA
mgnify:FL=1